MAAAIARAALGGEVGSSVPVITIVRAWMRDSSKRSIRPLRAASVSREARMLGGAGNVARNAIALGAKSVGLGRLPCLGLGAAGVPGLVRALEILENEVQTCLGLLGVTSFAELTPAHVTAAPPVGEHDVFSAFPLLPRD